jgi:hypothetical protein
MKYVLYERDDDYPLHLEANSKEEMKDKLWDVFATDGFCDCFITTDEEYKQILEGRNVE